MKAQIQKPSGRFEKEDYVVMLGLLAVVLAISGIVAFAHGDTAVALGILWGWIVEIAVWVYVFVSSI
jgi:hypothetical protein